MVILLTEWSLCFILNGHKLGVNKNIKLTRYFFSYSQNAQNRKIVVKNWNKKLFTLKKMRIESLSQKRSLIFCFLNK